MDVRRRLIIFTILFLAVFLTANFCLALNLKDAFKVSDKKDPLNAVAEQGAGFKTDVEFNDIVSTVITTVLSFMGMIFLILAIYAGYSWMMARGNEEMVERAKSTLTNALIGLVIVLAAYAISYFVLSQISPKTLRESPAAPYNPPY